MFGTLSMTRALHAMPPKRPTAAVQPALWHLRASYTTNPPPPPLPPSFDTYKFAQKLEEEGFSREQAEAIMTSFSEVIGER
ncbi:hypothetical protein AMAG_18553 [Allomyces macrogynus ATCC 38327]|uniref:Uncharacterized protein n=1 Tax=Allomyces macrogynus (strain ATCC 38327) TaxID=578462 RepID=A0A0L0SDB2_ALLM3|nr:hypothetical protein AMAG_18553 [Allomyces macrogynus ATCC 38327]|eukprot:KNE60523.1 hypothetical protein AMAG_18553 [Allomyces macrogynus ATCC 38327]